MFCSGFIRNLVFSLQSVCRESFGFLFILVAGFLTSCAPSPQLEIRDRDIQLKTDTNPQPKPDPVKVRSLEFAVDSNEFRAPVELLLIIDNSKSMSEEQQLLSAGIDSLMTSIYERKKNEVNLRIVTTTADDRFGGMRPASNSKTYYDYIDSTGSFVSTQDSLVLSQKIPLTKRQTYELNNSQAASGSNESVFPISPKMSPSEFGLIKSEIADLIANLGTTGSDTERGLCSFARTLHEEKEDRRFFKPGDLAAAIIISDSDDRSTESCLLQTEQDFGPVDPSTQPLQDTSDISTPGIEEKRYTIQFRSLESSLVQVEATREFSGCLVDGQVQDICQSSKMQYLWPAQLGPVVTPPFTQVYSVCPTELATDFAVRQGWPANELATCRYRFVTHWPSFSYSDREGFLSRDLCSDSFAVGSTVFDNLEDYFRKTNSHSSYTLSDSSQYIVNNCRSSYRYRSNYGQVGPARNIEMKTALDSSVTTLKSAIQNRANRLFGVNSWFISMIADLGDDLSCSGNSESIGDSYLDFLADLSLDYSSSLSICEPSYAAALDPIENFVEQQTINTYTIDLLPGEIITNVDRIRNSASQSLAIGTEVEIVGGRIRVLVPDLLNPNDRLHVLIQSGA